MTPTELAAVLERIAGDWIFRTPATETALRESAAILRRLVDERDMDFVANHKSREWWLLETYRRRVLTPAEPVRDVCRWRLAHGDSIDFYEPSCNKFQAFSKVHSACPDCGKPIQIEGEKP